MSKPEAERTVESGLNDGEDNPQGLPDDSERQAERKKQWLIEQGYYVEPLDIYEMIAQHDQKGGGR